MIIIINLLQNVREILQEVLEQVELTEHLNSSVLKNSVTIPTHVTALSTTYVYSAVHF